MNIRLRWAAIPLAVLLIIPQLVFGASVKKKEEAVASIKIRGHITYLLWFL